MARGWESKAVEDQQQSAQEREAQRTRVKVTEQQIVIERKRDSFLLQRTRVIRELEGSTGNGRYRETLVQALAHLESELTGLGWKPGTARGEGKKDRGRQIAICYPAAADSQSSSSADGFRA